MFFRKVVQYHHKCQFVRQFSEANDAMKKLVDLARRRATQAQSKPSTEVEPMKQKQHASKQKVLERNIAFDLNELSANNSGPRLFEKTWTIGSLYNRVLDMLSQTNTLAFGQGTLDAQEDAILLISYVLGLDFQEPLRKKMDVEISSDKAAKVLEICIQRLETKRPMAYLIGRAVQQGEVFVVSPKTLIPRSFLGELLFQDSLWNFKSSSQISMNRGIFLIDVNKVENVLDLCTGSGCLAILAARVFPNIKRVDAVDLSDEALRVARRNVVEKKLEGVVKLYQGNLFEALANEEFVEFATDAQLRQDSECAHNKQMKSMAEHVRFGESKMTDNTQRRKYDLILCNPPYVDAKAMRSLPTEFRHEPTMALYGGKDGLDIVRDIMVHASGYLNPMGGLICEIGRTQRALTKSVPSFFQVPVKAPIGYNGSRDDRIVGTNLNHGIWLDTVGSKGEVFFASCKALSNNASVRNLTRQM